jgi:hypothetical protein
LIFLSQFLLFSILSFKSNLSYFFSNNNNNHSF